MAIIERGTATAKQNDIKVVPVTITVGTGPFTTSADATLIGGKVISADIFPGTDGALLNAIPTISSTGVVSVTVSATTTVPATAYVTVSRATGNNV